MKAYKTYKQDEYVITMNRNKLSIQRIINRIAEKNATGTDLRNIQEFLKETDKAIEQDLKE